MDAFIIILLIPVWVPGLALAITELTRPGVNKNQTN